MKKLTLVALFLVLPLTCFIAPAMAGNLTLAYTAPTSCEDGSALTNCPITGYEVLSSTSATGTFATVETLGPTVLSKTYLNLAPGTKCYSVKSLSNGAKSAESTRVCASVPSLPPKAPLGLTVTVQVTVTTP